MTMQTSNGNWNIMGIRMISSDSIYKKIKSAIETGVGFDQTSLQNSTGHRAPIKIDKVNKTVQFFSF